MSYHYDDDPPLYNSGVLASKDEKALQREWERQCNIHDNGVDNYPMGHYIIEGAAARIKLIEHQQKIRGFRKGPSDEWLAE